MNGKKILFVEDEPVAQTVYCNRLKREGFETFFAEDGEVALNFLSRERPDLVILDLMLPKVNGTEVLKHIRSEPRLKEVPVLIFSNAYITDLSKKAMESGATRGLLKTEGTPAKLVGTVRDMLGYVSAFDLTDKPASDDSQSQAFIAAAEEAFADEMNLKESRGEFIKKAPALVAGIRECCQAYVKAGMSPEGRGQLEKLYQLVRFFETRAGLSGCAKIALLTSAFEALLFEILSKPERANASTFHTVAQAVDCLERLCQRSDMCVGEPKLAAKILVVDDDAVTNFAMVSALKRAHFEPVSMEDPAQALETAKTSLYDVILLDINMPNINGFELCEKLRALPEYKNTPIVFVTSTGDFQNRARGVLSGGNDLIPKPISPVELVLKTTMHLLQPQGARAETPTAAQALKAIVRPVQPETSAQAATPPPARNGSAPNAPSVNGSIPFAPATPDWSKKPAAPDTANGKASFFTELVKKAWGGQNADLPRPDEKPARAEAGNDTAKIAPLKIKDDLPKPGIAATSADKQPAVAETIIKPAAPEIPIEPPKPLEEPKPAQAGETNKKDEPKATEIKNEPKAEIPAVAGNAPPPAVPAPAAEKKDSQTNPKLNPVDTIMETKNTPTLDEAARGVARIIFGDENLTDMNVRLTRIALEKYNVPGTQKMDDVARGVTQIIFGDDKVSDMNMRLTKIALERYNVTEVLNPNGSAKPADNGTPHL